MIRRNPKHSRQSLEVASGNRRVIIKDSLNHKHNSGATINGECLNANEDMI